MYKYLDTILDTLFRCIGSQTVGATVSAGPYKLVAEFFRYFNELLLDRNKSIDDIMVKMLSATFKNDHQDFIMGYC
jgi:hypothetical protein